MPDRSLNEPAVAGKEPAAEDVAPRPRFFYGWVIVAVMAVTGTLTTCMGTLNFDRFTTPISSYRYRLHATAS